MKSKSIPIHVKLVAYAFAFFIFQLFSSGPLFANVKEMKKASIGGEGAAFLFEAENLMQVAEVTVKGTVSSDDGEILPGVTILVKGTSRGTTTDPEGNYSITTDENAILIFSFLGYRTAEIPLNSQTTLDVVLEFDLQLLSEVVVVGYGTEEKKDLTGAVAVVDAQEIENRQSIQLSDALQGSMAGVTVTRGNGGPGQGGTIRVRGATSLNVNNPLVIVDGIQGLSLDDINPNDVESISVLKDAASQAIYGARAAAGVILVTTKGGKEGALSVNYDYEFGSNSPTELPSYVDAATYREVTNEHSTNDGGGEPFDPAETAIYDELHAQDPDQFPDTNWQDAILSQSPTTRHRHNLSVTAGSKKVDTYVSMSYVDEDGIYENSNFERFTFRANNGIKLSEIAEVNVDLYYRRTNTVNPSINTSTSRNETVALSRRYPAVFSAVRTDGEWGEGKDGINPLALVADGGQITENLNQLNGILGITLKPITGLTVRANFSPTLGFDKYNRFYRPPNIPRLGSTTEFWPREISILEKRQTTATTLTTQATVTYEREFGQHNFLFLGGYEEVNTDWDRFATTSRDLSIELDALEFGDPLLTQNRQNTSENNIRSFFGRLGYDFGGRYLLQSNFRVDGSSRFAPDERWGFFPSLSAGWVVSEENFGLPGFISFLKVRGSYGEVGNERIGTQRTGGAEFFNFYPYQGLFELVNTVFYDGSNFVSGLGITQDFLADEFLVWETTRTLDAGIDLGFMDDRLNLTVDLYRKRTEDIIITQDLPDYLGFPDDTKTNVGTIEIEGLDIELGYRNSIGQLNYAINANMSTLRSEIIDVGGLETFLVNGNTQIHTLGAGFGEWFGYETRGLYQTQEEIDEYGVTDPISPGDIWHVDQLTVDTDGDGIPDARDNVINGEDRVPLGTSLPTFMYGGNIALDYKGFDFALVFNGVGRHIRRYSNIQVQPLTEAFGNVPLEVAEGTWRPGNTDAQNQSARFPRYSGASAGFNYAVSDFWLYNAKYLRIQNITLGYTLPTNLTEKTRLQKLRFYVGLRNFFTIDGSELLDGWDPEVDFDGHPVMKSVLFGVNAKF